MGDNNTPEVCRRQVLKTVGASAAAGAVGVTAFTGTATAWERQTVNFKDCSEAQIVVSAADIKHDPPTLVRVVVAEYDGTLACRDVEITQENTTLLLEEYGFAPVRKVRVEDWETMLGVIFYNYDEEERFSSASCIITNDNQCAMTEDTPSIEDATCVQDARENGGHDCDPIPGDDSEQSDRGNSRDEEAGYGWRGLPTAVRNNLWSYLTGVFGVW